MDLLRYAIALLLVVAIPAVLLVWLLIHPFAPFWRRLGPGVAYPAVLAPTLLLMAGIASLRSRLLATDWGLRLPLLLLGLVFLGISGWLLLLLRRKLPLRVLIGLPELSATSDRGEPITDGIYGRIRHPRYVQMTFALLGYSLIANYPACYAAFLFWCAGIYVVALLEERELAARFGASYVEYCRRVPRYVPRLRR